jgi:hypothetical protein
MVIVPVTVAAFENGRQVTRTAYRTEYRMLKRTVALEKDTAYDAAGKKVSAGEALKRLKVGDTVLISTQQVDPLYLRVIRPETLILVSATAQAPIPIRPLFPKNKSGEPPVEPLPKR